MIPPPRFTQLIERYRVLPSRKVDQIAMTIPSLFEQAIRTTQRVSGKSIVFVGDCDLAAVATAYAALECGYIVPDISVVDFDDRVLNTTRAAFGHLGLDKLLRTENQNFFNSSPESIIGRHDIFYTNPPYGRYNGGQSVLLFVVRGMEMSHESAEGHLLIPCDISRPWTVRNVMELESTVLKLGGKVRLADQISHSYILDDDPTLQSRTLRLTPFARWNKQHPWMFKSLSQSDIPNFYGRDKGFQSPTLIDEFGRFGYLGDRDAS